MVKQILKNFLPDFLFSNLTDIDADFFKGAQLIIFDLDNTLVFSEGRPGVPSGSYPGYPETKKEIIDWFHKINSRYKCTCLSNNRAIFDRKEKISKLLNCQMFLSRHKKPFKRLFREIKEKYNFENDKVFVVGDRIFTDILFGNLNGAKTILVKPLGKKENIFIKIIRKVEWLVLFLARFNV